MSTWAAEVHCTDDLKLVHTVIRHPYAVCRERLLTGIQQLDLIAGNGAEASAKCVLPKLGALKHFTGELITGCLICAAESYQDIVLVVARPRFEAALIIEVVWSAEPVAGEPMSAIASRVSMLSRKGIAHPRLVGSSDRPSAAHVAMERASEYIIGRCIILGEWWLMSSIDVDQIKEMINVMFSVEIGWESDRERSSDSRVCGEREVTVIGHILKVDAS
jgi:hypothetical protein